MKKIIVLLLVFFLFQNTFSQANYTQLEMTGYNADVVCTASSCSDITPIDDQWYFYSAAKKTEGALPQSITSKMGIEYHLAPFETDNVLRLGCPGNLSEGQSNPIASGKLVLKTPVQTEELWLLGLSASSKKEVEIVVEYTDNTKSNVIKTSFPDWHQANAAKTSFHGLGRVKGGTNYDSNCDFALFERVILVDASKTVKAIAFEYKGSDKTFTSIFAVSAYMGGERKSDNELYMISNAHFDTQWDWDVQTSIDQYVKNTLEGNFNLFDKYPNYTFNFEGAIKYMFAKEYYPQLYERLKTYVASGRWHISGGSIDANDVMVPSAESIIRNFLLGQEFYKKEFGVKGGNDIMLPDCFGFPYSLPTLGKHCGIIGFHSQKLSWGSAYNYDALPHYGIWEGVDGSRILAVHKPGAYVNQYRENMAYNTDVLYEIMDNKNKLGATKTVRYFGTGDRGGSIDDSTAEWLEKSLASDGLVKVNVVTPDEFFESISPEEEALLPVWNNELPMRVHGVGCYSSQTILKYWNRKGELLADATEKSSYFADWLGGLPYQSEIIRDNWIRLLWHQFHDDLTGTSIPKAYVFTHNDLVLAQLNFAKTMNNAVGAVSRKLDTQVSGTPIFIYNPLSIQRTDIVEASTEASQRPEYLSVYDNSGNAVPAQILGYEEGKLSFIFKADVPSLGYAVYELRLNDDASSKVETSLSIEDKVLENDEYKIKLNNLGDVESIIDKKQNNKELLKSPIRLSLSSDNPGYWGSWEISWGDNERAPSAYVNGNPRVSIHEKGPLRASFKVERTKNGSEFVQYVRMTSGVNEDRIDFVNEVEWQTKQTMLKVVFPMTVTNDTATYDMSIGTIKRGNRKSDLHEVAGHQWADMTNNDKSFGISILNDCKYGWDKVDKNTLRLTLIHTPGVESDRKFQKHQDLGLNVFTYSFYRHLNDWDENTVWQASKLNQPLYAYEVPKHDGVLGKSLGFATLSSDKVGIKALKKAEASDEMIVRVYELVGENHGNVEIAFPADIVSAKEVNGLEERVGDVAFSGKKLSFAIGKYQPKSFAVKLADYSNDNKLQEPSSNKIELTYNIDVMSTDARMKDGRFGTSNYVYPAELFDDEIVADGISFKVGPRENGQLNAVKCQGQEIAIPETVRNKKIYILAASANPEGSEVDFLVDGKAHNLKIDYFAEFIGRWGTAFASQNYRKENVAFLATHRHNYSTNKNDSYSYLYIYKYLISLDEEAKTITLPDNSDVIVFAISTSDNENDNVNPITETYCLPEYKDLQASDDIEFCGDLLRPTTVTASGSTNAYERPAMAADNDPYTKWVCEGTSKWLRYKFDKPVTICQWNILNAGIEGDHKISSDFKLQRYDGKVWVDVDVVNNNKLNKSYRTLSEPITTDEIRLFVTTPEQEGGSVTRIYSFDVYGQADETNIDEVKIVENSMRLRNAPNPFSISTTISCYIENNVDNIRLDIYSLTGTLVDTRFYPANEGENIIVWNNIDNLKGLYLYRVSLMKSDVILEQATAKMLIE